MSDGHECAIPSGAKVGALWQCIHCGKYWFRSSGSIIGWTEVDLAFIELYNSHIGDFEWALKQKLLRKAENRKLTKSAEKQKEVFETLSFDQRVVYLSILNDMVLSLMAVTDDIRNQAVVTYGHVSAEPREIDKRIENLKRRYRFLKNLHESWK